VRGALYVIGPPGSGKSTTLSAALSLAGLLPNASTDQPFAMTLHNTLEGTRPTWVLGRPGAVFAGTDALAMNVAPRVREWLLGASPAAVVAEGDRLANPSTLDVLWHTCPDGVLAVLDLPPALSWDRMVRRADALGRPPQSEAWWKGRVTKVANLASRYAPRAHHIDATGSPDEMAEALVWLLP
jgi:hypothetical protein